MPDFGQLDPSSYVPCDLHSGSQVFPETNCYTDLWIELLHAQGMEPAAALACGLAVDFEGDQWTFLKPPPEDLALLYGVDVHEMQLYRPITDHICEQLARGRMIIIEADSYYLPDTAGLTYREAHEKSAIAVAALTPAAERLVYFHGRGLHEARQDDYRHLVRAGPLGWPAAMPPYVELVRFDAGSPVLGLELHAAALGLLARHLARRPRRNPWPSFAAWLADEIPALVDGDAQHYHAVAFATARQAGAAFQAAQAFVDWVLPTGPARLAASQALGRQAEGARTLLLKLARRRPFALADLVDPLAAAYDEAMEALDAVTRDRPAGTG